MCIVCLDFNRKQLLEEQTSRTREEKNRYQTTEATRKKGERPNVHHVCVRVAVVVVVTRKEENKTGLLEATCMARKEGTHSSAQLR